MNEDGRRALHDGLDRMRETPLHVAATFGDCEMVKALLVAGGNPNARTPTTYKRITPLRNVGLAKELADKDALAVAVLLLDGAAEPLDGDNERATPLHFAVSGGKPELAALLIARGANVHARTKWGHTPLDWVENLEVKPSAKVVAKLKKLLATPTAPEAAGATARPRVAARTARARRSR